MQVVALDGNILFSVDLPGPAPLPALGPDQESASTPVDVTATRCDPHALTESKRSFTFPVRVRLDGGEPVLLEVTVDVDGRRALQSLLESTCPALGASASAG